MFENPNTELKTIGPYDLLEELPSEGIARSFVVRREGTQNLAILRRLAPAAQEDRTARSRFVRECEIAVRLDHPNLIKGLEYGAADGISYMVTELVVGCPLRTVLSVLAEDNQGLELEHFVTVADSVLKGLHFAHGATDSGGRALGIVHRNLSPDNILVAFNGDVRIANFALARARTGDFNTTFGMSVGTAAYLSPEQARGYPLDQRSDLYTLGITFHEMLTGRRVISKKGFMDAIRAIMEESPSPLRRERTDVPEALDDVIQQATAKSARDRYKTAEDMRQALIAATSSSTQPNPQSLGRFMRSLLPGEQRRVENLLQRVQARAESRSAPPTTEPEPVLRLPGPSASESGSLGPSYEDGPQASSDPEEAAIRASGRRGKNRTLRKPLRLFNLRLTRRSIAPFAVAGLGMMAFAAALTIRLLRRPPEPAPVPPTQLAPVTPPTPVDPPDAPDETPENLPSRIRPEPSSPSADRTLPEPPPGVPLAPQTTLPRGPANLKPSPTIRRGRRDPLADRIEALRENPDDVEAFEQLHAALRARARRLPARKRGPIVAVLDEAERAQDVELLARALSRLRSTSEIRPTQ